MACDWQLSARTLVWQRDLKGEVLSSSALAAFQRDLNALRRVSDDLTVCSHLQVTMIDKNHIVCLHFQWARPRVYLHEATVRMMAGAAPNKTQQLLDRSLIQKASARGLICGKGINLEHQTLHGSVSNLDFFADDRVILTGEREHAIALYMACRHLPSQLLSSPGERAGMLTEAAKTLKKIGDQKSLEACNSLMKTLGTSLTA